MCHFLISIDCLLHKPGSGQGRSKLMDDGTTGYQPIAKDERAHSRMVLDICWSPADDIFVTASRDKTVKLWTKSTSTSSSEVPSEERQLIPVAEEQWTLGNTLRLVEPATAVDMISTDRGEL